MNTRALSWIPNALTISRLVLAIAFIWIPPSWRLPVVLIALATEYLDGDLARRWNVTSAFGQLLDPIADKLFVAITLIVLVTEGHLSLLQILLVALRDLTVLAGSAWLLFKHDWARLKRMKPRLSGKIATVGQFATLISYYAELPIATYVLWATMVSSLIAAIDYTHIYIASKRSKS